MAVISHRRLSGKHFECIYNTGRLQDDEVRSLVENGQCLLPPEDPDNDGARSEGSRSQVVPHARQLYLVRDFLPEPLLTRARDCIGLPPSFRCFRKGAMLLDRGIRTPTPVLAAIIKVSGRRREVFLTDYIEYALPLDQYLQKGKRQGRQADLMCLAEFLSELHTSGFYACGMCSRHILVDMRQSGPVFSITNARRIRFSRWLSPKAFTHTVSQVCGDVYGLLPQQERHFLLAACFDFALKMNIFTEPSQRGSFVDNVIARVHESAQPRSFFLRWNW